MAGHKKSREREERKKKKTKKKWLLELNRNSVFYTHHRYIE
jgi:hypothetical protein